MATFGRRLSVLLLATSAAVVLAALSPGAALASGRAETAGVSSPSTLVRACDRAVCETVTGVGYFVHSVQGVAYAAGPACGQFVLTIASPQGRSVLDSPPVCGSRPAYTFTLDRSFPPGTVLYMQFTNPQTPGRPAVRLPLRLTQSELTSGRSGLASSQV